MADTTHGAPGLPTGIHCPFCGLEIRIPEMPWSKELLAILRLRANDLGTQVECSRCRRSFMHRNAPRPAFQKRLA